MNPEDIILKPRSEGASILAERIRTGRRELRLLLNPQRDTFSAERGIRRTETKRPNDMSARQWKKTKKHTKRWYKANVSWFGAEEAAKVGDKRIPCVKAGASQ